MIPTLGRSFWDDLSQGDTRVFGVVLVQDFRLGDMRRCCCEMQKETNVIFGHGLELCVGRRSNDSHDVQELILVIPATEQRHTSYHFGEDAAARPNVDRGAVCPRSEENVWRAVP